MVGRRTGSFRDLPIRSKLFVGCVIVIVVAIGLGGAALYSSVRQTLRANIEQQLRTSTYAVLNLIRTTIDSSIKNHLRAVAEQNRDLVRYYFRRYQEGELTDEQARQRAARALLSQVIGTTGYVYCIDSKGVVRVHPKQALVGVDLSKWAFIRKQKQLHSGYLEYDWANPGEPARRPKALYMTYFKPWDWIISASSYRTEFAELFRIDDLRQSVLSMRFGKTGYAYILDTDGLLIVHPKLEGSNVLNVQDATGRRFVREIIAQKDGKMTYIWRNPGEVKARKKLIIYHYIPELKWVVAASSYLEEVYAPLRTVGLTIVLTMLLMIVLIIPTTWWLARSITMPLRWLSERFERGAKGDYSGRLDVERKDEIGTLARYYNGFMEQLEGYSSSLENLVLERTADLARAKRNAEAARDAALEAGQAKSQFLANMSHEVRTPMNAIIGLSELALREDLPARLRDYVGKIRSSSSTLLELIDNVLDFSQLETGRLELVTRQSALRDTIAAAVDRVADLARKKGLALNMTVGQGVPQIVICDPLRIYQVLTNLLDNAVKFSEQGVIRLDVRGERTNPRQVVVRFEISDPGIGIAPERIPELFSAFTQLDDSLTRKHGGSGLGLATCERLVRLMGGKLEVSSEPGAGSTFSFGLVLETPVPIDLAVQRDVSRSGGEAIGSPVLTGGSASSDPSRNEAPDEEAVLRERFVRLAALLDKARFESLGQQRELAEQLGISAPAELEQVGRQIEALEFDEARATLQRLAEARGIELSHQRPFGGAVLREGDGAALPPLPGIDLQLGLRHTDGNAELLKQVLVGLVEQFGDIGEQMRAALSDEDVAVARRLAHGFKGLVGTVGARSLHASCIALDRALALGDLVASNALLPSFLQHVETVMTGLSKLRRDTDDREPGGNGEKVDRSALEQQLAELATALTKGDVGALQAARRLSRALADTGLEREGKRLAQLIEAFDFVEAQSLLSGLRANLTSV